MAVSGQFEYKSAKTPMSEYKSIILYYFLLVGILIMLLFLAIVCICSRRRRHVHGNEIEEAHVAPEIELVPLCASSQSEIEEITCVICISDIECGEEFVRFPCLHSYHIQCIDQWMQISPMCPLCNKT